MTTTLSPSTRADHQRRPERRRRPERGRPARFEVLEAYRAQLVSELAWLDVELGRARELRAGAER